VTTGASAYEKQEDTIYLNVDVDVLASRPLNALIAAFGNRIHVHYCGRERGQYSAHFSLGSMRQSASLDSAIRGLVELVKRLPATAYRLWERATERTLNVGIQSGIRPRSREFEISRARVQAVADIGASIVFTVYAAELHAPALLKKAAPRRPTTRSTATRAMKPARAR